ncbi:MAG: hypothetical protein IJR36_06605 [Lachnospiraceae bacterium]|nr:hypothetical protein [Lachnospiraceae bacterium]
MVENTSVSFIDLMIMLRLGEENLGALFQAGSPYDIINELKTQGAAYD